MKTSDLSPLTLLWDRLAKGCQCDGHFTWIVLIKTLKYLNWKKTINWSSNNVGGAKSNKNKNCPVSLNNRSNC